jgi:glycosyltransferase involved in cell wall biosynthesis
MMPAYNAEKYISKAIRSFLSQSYKKAELVVVDDASTDATLNIAFRYAKKHAKVIVLSNSQHLGIAKSRNIALRQARGKFVGHLDADDWLDKNALKNAVKSLSKRNVALVYSGYVFVNRLNKTKQKMLVDKVRKDNLHLLGWQHFGMYRKDVALNVGGFNEKLITCSDGDLFIRIAQKYKCVRIPVYLYNYRWHENNTGHIRKHCDWCKNKYCEFYKVWKRAKGFRCRDRQLLGHQQGGEHQQ